VNRSGEFPRDGGHAPVVSRPSCPKWQIGPVCTVLFLYALASLAGCGDGTNRVPVEGEVTLDGKPLEEGAISFLSTSEGSSAGARIASGRFAIARQDGPTPGVYRVEILAYKETGRRIPDPDRPGKMMDETLQLVPQRYNFQSELEVELKPDAPNRLEFRLETP